MWRSVPLGAVHGDKNRAHFPWLQAAGDPGEEEMRGHDLEGQAHLLLEPTAPSSSL